MAKPGRPRFSIGIDLGTSNCALAYVDLRAEDPSSRVLEIPQWESAGRSVTLKLLPSFAYFPEDPAPFGRKQVVGACARDVSALEPGRVAFSAKSWLTHAGVDRHAKILPWGSTEIPAAEKLSPVEVSALYLEYLRAAWNQAMAGDDERNAFDRQRIVVAVPASFDQGAQKLTLEAARLAGYPSGVRLLEEPQAAFYAWLERHPEPEALRAALAPPPGAHPRILVCDIGGGTSDFSRFSVEFREDGAAQIRRLAVSDHILLGGDNIDLAIARSLEAQVAGEGGRLDPSAWQRLAAESRRVKEAALAGFSEGNAGDTGKTYRVGVAGSGGNLFTQAKTASITDREIADLIENGFFPPAAASERPRAAGKGLREMGLPYAADSAVTRYLAAFHAEGGPVDAMLFNGGTMTPPYLQRRLSDLVAAWQNGRAPRILENRELDLAVARGAASHGRHLALGLKARISAGSAHGYYLEAAAQEKQESRYLICILPLGTESEEAQTIGKLDLRLALNRPVEFRLYDSTHRPEDRAGNILKFSAGQFRELPPLRTVARLDEEGMRALGSQDIAVGIQAVMNSLGLLQVHLVSSDKRLQPPARWELEFDMRALGGAEAPVQTADTDKDEALPPEGKASAFALLSADFPPGVLSQVEKALGRSRGSWPRSWLRQLWEPLHASMGRRSTPEFEAAWLNAAGYLLRPGFGAELDDYRMDQLWRVQAVGLTHPKSKAVRDQYWLMWRRVAGGLSAKRQNDVFQEARPLIESHHRLDGEAVRMAGSFERLSREDREWLLDVFLQGAKLKRDQDPGHYLFALGRLLSRVPLYAGEESVLPPAAVEKAFAFFRDWDWNEGRAGFLPVLFAQAGRVTNHRALDIPPALRGAVTEKMRAAGAGPKLLRQVSEFVPMEREDFTQLFGDPLPLGLAIRKFS